MTIEAPRQVSLPLAESGYSMEEQTTILSFVVTMCLIITYLVVIQIFFMVTKKNDPLLFKEMGSPHLFSNNTAKSIFLSLRALFTFKHMVTSNMKVVLWGNAALILFIVALTRVLWAF